MTISPNPADESIRISGITGDVTMKITDLTGKDMMMQSLGTGADRVDISRLAPGLYLVQFYRGTDVFVTKLIVR